MFNFSIANLNEQQMRRVIRLGDRTSQGGVVVSASSLHTIGGIGVARLGDKCTCPKKGHHNCVIVEGDPSWTIDGKPVALEGHKTSCGSVLLSSSPNTDRVYGSNEANPMLQAHIARFQQTAPQRAERVADSECITTDNPDQIKQIAHRMLGIDTAQLPGMAKRRENWQKFVKRHIPKRKDIGLDEANPERVGPIPGIGAYAYLETTII